MCEYVNMFFTIMFTIQVARRAQFAHLVEIQANTVKHLSDMYLCWKQNIQKCLYV